METHRRLRGPAQAVFMIFTWAGLAVVVFNIFRFSIAGQVMLEYGYLAVILGLFLPLVFLTTPATRKSSLDKIPWYDIVLAVVSMVPPAIVYYVALDIVQGSWPVNPPPFLFALGLITCILIVEAVRRSTGLVLAGLIVLCATYPLYASSMPDLLVAKSYSLNRLIGYHFLSTGSIFGLPLQAFANMVIGFMLFGIALEATGAGKFLLDVAIGLLGRVKGGPALVSILASAMLASMTGSAVANVISVGTITIPAMKRMGVKSHVAAAIEAVASTGGMLMPPVMGATAFLMAAMLRISYAEVCIAAAIPMIVYYTSLFGQIWSYAHRHDWGTWPESEIPSVKKSLKYGWFYLGSIVVLIYLLFYMRVESWAPFYATIFLIFCAFLRKQTRPNINTLKRFTLSLGSVLAQLTPVIAGVGMIIGALLLTGVGQSLAGGLVELAEGNLYLLLLLGGIGSIILGTGMTITACYIFMALMFAPALTEAGAPTTGAHLFFLYWGMLGDLTPPVCLSVFVASTIAGSEMMATGFQAMRIAIMAYIIPFLFVLNPALLCQGPPRLIAWSAVTAIIGGLIISGAVEGYEFGIGRVGFLGGVILFISGLLLLFTGWMPNTIGILIYIAFFAYGFLKKTPGKKNMVGRAQP